MRFRSSSLSLTSWSLCERVWHPTFQKFFCALFGRQAIPWAHMFISSSFSFHFFVTHRSISFRVHQRISVAALPSMACSFGHLTAFHLCSCCAMFVAALHSFCCSRRHFLATFPQYLAVIWVGRSKYFIHFYFQNLSFIRCRRAYFIENYFPRAAYFPWTPWFTFIALFVTFHFIITCRCTSRVVGHFIHGVPFPAQDRQTAFLTFHAVLLRAIHAFVSRRISFRSQRSQAFTLTYR